LYSDNTIQVFYNTIKKVDIQLQKGVLLTVEHQALQTKLRADYNKKAKSRKSTHKGGASAPVSQLRTEIKAKEEADRAEELRKAQKKLTQAMNKAKKELKDAGIQARKDERARTDKLKEIYARGDLPPPELLFPIREPDKNPTVVEQARLLEDFYPELVQQIKELKAQQEHPAQLDLYADNDDDDDDDDVVINTIAVIYKKDEVVDFIDSSPPLPEYVDSSDAESIDSIRRNADFVAF
jgi:hypothetical protein